MGGGVSDGAANRGEPTAAGRDDVSHDPSFFSASVSNPYRVEDDDDRSLPSVVLPQVETVNEDGSVNTSSASASTNRFQDTFQSGHAMPAYQGDPADSTKGLVPLVMLQIHDMSRHFCGGYIGAGKSKICINSRCNIQSHKTRRATDAFKGGEHRIFIATPTGQSVFASPSVAPETFGDDLSKFLSERRPQLAWQTLFEAYNSTAVMSAMEKAEVDKLMSADALNFAITPRRPRRIRFEEGERVSPGMDDDLLPMMDELSESESLNNMLVEDHWPTLVTNVNKLHAMIQKLQRAVAGSKAAMREEFTRVDAKLAALKVLIGTPSEVMGTADVYAALEELQMNSFTHEDWTGGLAQLRKLIQRSVESVSAMSASRHLELQATIEREKNELVRGFNQALAPLIKLFGAFSTHKTTPGDKVWAAVSNLEKQVTAQRPGIIGVPHSSSTIGGEAAMASTPSVSWNLPGSTNTFSVAGPSAAPTGGVNAPDCTSDSLEKHDLLTQLADLRNRLSSVEDQLAAQSVRVNRVNFKSPYSAAGWLKENCPGDFAFAHFVDACSLLALAAGKGSTVESVLKFEESSKKLAFDHAGAAIVAISFDLQLPSVFGKIDGEGESHRVLPAIKTYDQWDSQDGDIGVRYLITRGCNSVLDDLTNNFEFNLTGDAHMVASAMLNESYHFINSLVTWINSSYTDQIGRGADAKDTWRHIGHAVRCVFSLLYEARKAGRGNSTLAAKNSAMFWGSLQCLSAMRELLKYKFAGHPEISYVLFEHLRDNGVSKSEFSGLAKRLKTAEERLEQVRKTADRAASGKKGKEGKDV